MEDLYDKKVRLTRVTGLPVVGILRNPRKQGNVPINKYFVEVKSGKIWKIRKTLVKKIEEVK